MLFELAKKTIAPLVLRRAKEINGRENLPKKGPFLIIANHVSYLDPVLIGALVAKWTGQKTHFISKHDLFRYFGRRIGEKWLGMIYVDPNDRQACLKAALNFLRQGEVVGVFPEGTRWYQAGTLKKGKTGAARLALWSQCPVVPVGYIGPMDKDVKNHLSFIFSKKQEIRINIGKPLDLAKYLNQEITHRLLEEVTKEMLKAISQLSGKKYSY
ncbi:MAG: hypothetical protein COY66_03345 [Candidatus Kerfeldbacteria bacterium CG_4_10_14_0_8_um_filter_42_10]|uniref:Phospholipid/glycerol acyltransferase domain-containing protein n=1 Tax=Candidatus Kerfeldbacteria bacterium CG_4_10_14_0_8_um_filter_42_10 TaxID=2014248 RepID=A0A2M7RIZ4_9BACT|nr:MAG: hypothetical protein COY66_03345 [Candidatus Kerfeldbacteria bacterium CG_4_10_14_0_8_um_filter_42_10]